MMKLIAKAVTPLFCSLAQLSTSARMRLLLAPALWLRSHG